MPHLTLRCILPKQSFDEKRGRKLSSWLNIDYRKLSVVLRRYGYFLLLFEELWKCLGWTLWWWNRPDYQAKENFLRKFLFFIFSSRSHQKTTHFILERGPLLMGSIIESSSDRYYYFKISFSSFIMFVFDWGDRFWEAYLCHSTLYRAHRPARLAISAPAHNSS